jgi:hypothetical protein
MYVFKIHERVCQILATKKGLRGAEWKRREKKNRFQTKKNYPCHSSDDNKANAAYVSALERFVPSAEEVVGSETSNSTCNCKLEMMDEIVENFSDEHVGFVKFIRLMGKN